MTIVGGELVGQPGIAGWDPLRIVIDIRGTGCTGYEIAAELRASYDIYIELASHATLVLVLGMGQPVEPLERFAHDFAETVRRISARPARARPSPAPRRRSSTTRWCRSGTRFSAWARWWRSTTRSDASRARRSPAIRRGSRRCCRASG